VKPSDNNYAISDFTHELVADVKAGGYGLRAWKVLLARSWARSIDDIRASPARARSLVQWSAVGAVVGAGILGLTLAMQDSGLAFRAIALWLPWYAGTGCQVEVIGAPPAYLRSTSGLVKHTLPRSKRRRHEPAAFGGWLPAAGGVRHGRGFG